METVDANKWFSNKTTDFIIGQMKIFGGVEGYAKACIDIAHVTGKILAYQNTVDFLTAIVQQKLSEC